MRVPPVSAIVCACLLAVFALAARGDAATPRRTASLTPFGVYTVNVNGSGLSRIDASATRRNHTHILPGTPWFVGEEGEGQTAHTSIFVEQTNGSGYATLLADPAAIEFSPVWSADGSAIIDASDRLSPYPGFTDVLSVATATGAVTNLTNTLLSIEGDPDARGGAIVYNRLDADQIERLYRMNADGSGQTQLTNPSGSTSDGYAPGDYDPKLSPDGTTIAYETHPANGVWLLSLLTLASGQQRTLGGGAMPCWSPDGSSIVYWDPSAFTLWTLRVAGGAPHHIPTPVGMQAQEPDWDGSGRVIFSGYTP